MPERRAPRLLVVAAGTGGHIVPGVVFARAARASGAEAALAAGARPVEEQVYAALGEERLRVPLRVGINARGRLAPWNVARDLAAAARTLRAFRPDAVLSMGGAYGVPFLLAAKAMGLPVFLHESNRRPGRVTRIFARLAERAFLGFPPDAAVANALVTGTPARSVEPAAVRDTVCFLGGSLGAKRVADAGAELARGIVEAHPGLRVVVLGASAPEGSAADPSIEFLPFCADVPALLARSVLAVSRAGASTLVELAAAGAPAVLVPYPRAKDDHQRANARFAAERGAAVMVDEVNDPQESLEDAVRALLADPARAAAMGAAARTLNAADPCAAMLSTISQSLDARRTGGAATLDPAEIRR
ncbi:MAG: UDP-N-acetylglucosamine--N-acetylmuramyl-(pentapeptide) pyrophosphoryl-undecaprenol N-acetylglucosamine transferase [Candidatus Sumerlaeia bacterium]|nr:UDP-N-acetylglucosamine--N-acetylmuramyl-(pentapeptide) pyrophosphoryl-undecaprenol N-acetylglucosamine transferase [Candidatus Sumerlaeia bacterium]